MILQNNNKNALLFHQYIIIPQFDI